MLAVIETQPMMLTAKQAAALCGLSVPSWYRYTASGRTPREIRVSGAVRWRRSDLEKWIELGCPSRDEFEAAK